MHSGQSCSFANIPDPSTPSVACGEILYEQIELVINVTGGWSHFEMSCESCPTNVITFEPSVYTLTGLTHSTAYVLSVKTVTTYYQLGAEHDKTSEPGTVTCQTLERGMSSAMVLYTNVFSFLAREFLAVCLFLMTHTLGVSTDTLQCCLFVFVTTFFLLVFLIYRL